MSRLSDHTLPIAQGRPRPFIMAHRGNSELCPENTLASFQRAIDDGTDVIETDLHVSADGEFICIHDGTLERTTDGHGAVKEMTVAQLKQVSASYGRPEFTTERIPTLREVLAILPEHIALGLELKADDFLQAEVCKRLQALFEEMKVLNRVFTLSFSRARLDAIRTHTILPTGLITLYDLLPERNGEFVGPLWPVMFLNPLYVALAQRRGQLVCPLDPTPEPRLWYYRLLGCDAVLTNNPAKTLRALGR